MSYQLIGIEKTTSKERDYYNMIFIEAISKEKGEGFKPLLLRKYGKNGWFTTYPSSGKYPSDLKLNGKYDILFNQFGDIAEIRPV